MQYITSIEGIEEAKYYMAWAAVEAKRSKCKKSKRGAIIVKDNKVISFGHNKPKLEELCCLRSHIKDNSRVELCTALHAEQMAIINAVNRSDLIGSTLYHIKVKNGEMRTSGKPSCTICSRPILESGIAEIVLWHKEGYAIYTAEEFNRLSFQYLLIK